MINGMGVALQLYSVRDSAEADLSGTLRAVRAMGYEGVEFAGLYGYTPEALRALLAEIRLTAVSAHVSVEELAADPAGVVAAYREIGCRYIAVPWLNRDKRPGTPGYETVKKDIRRAAEECVRQGLTLLYHNHDFEFVIIDGEYALDRLYREIPAALLQTELDTCWVRVSGEDPAAYIRKYSGRAPVVHLKDYAGEGESFEYRPLGQGVQDIPAILSAAGSAGSAWIVVEQDSPTPGMMPMECVQAGIEYMRSLQESG